MKQTSLDIVIVNWNSGDYLQKCIDSISLIDTTDINLNIFIIDNASSNNFMSSVDGIDLPITVMNNSINVGFGAACNQAASIGNSEYILFLNPDTTLFSNSLTIPLEFMNTNEAKKVGVCGIQLLDENNIARSCARFPTFTTLISTTLGINYLFNRHWSSYIMFEWDHKDSRPVDHVIGAFYLIRRSLFKQLGGFDKKFFVYLEDIDLSYRASQLGWSSYYLSNVQAFHKGGGTSEQIKATRLFYSIRSKIIYSYKHLNTFKATFILLISLFFEPFARIFLSLKNLSLVQFNETLSAYKKLFMNLKDIYFLIRKHN